MPGLLQTPDDMFGSARFASAVAAELLVRNLQKLLSSMSLHLHDTMPHCECNEGSLDLPSLAICAACRAP